MDSHQFDHLARSLAVAVPRRVALLVAPAITVACRGWRAEGAGAKRRRKNKPKPRCRGAGRTCSEAASGHCCGNLVCDDTNCGGDPICVQDQDGPCNDVCDCRLGLQCSERTGTCRQCSLLQTPCQSSEECCLASAGCGLTTVSGTEHVCCQRLGATCGLDSDCCGDTSKCGSSTGVGCNRVETVCCRQQGFPCDGDCDCCDPRRCISGICQ